MKSFSYLCFRELRFALDSTPSNFFIFFCIIEKKNITLPNNLSDISGGKKLVLHSLSINKIKELWQELTKLS